MNPLQIIALLNAAISTGQEVVTLLPQIQALMGVLEKLVAGQAPSPSDTLALDAANTEINAALAAQVAAPAAA
jgi:hypothetical protein